MRITTPGGRTGVGFGIDLSPASNRSLAMVILRGLLLFKLLLLLVDITFGFLLWFADCWANACWLNRLAKLAAMLALVAAMLGTFRGLFKLLRLKLVLVRGKRLLVTLLTLLVLLVLLVEMVTFWEETVVLVFRFSEEP